MLGDQDLDRRGGRQVDPRAPGQEEVAVAKQAVDRPGLRPLTERQTPRGGQRGESPPPFLCQGHRAATYYHEDMRNADARLSARKSRRGWPYLRDGFRRESTRLGTRVPALVEFRQVLSRLRGSNN